MNPPTISPTNRIDLKMQIAAAVAVRWDDFAAAHPILAGVIDQALLVESVCDALANDPDHHQALVTAREVEAGLETVIKLIDGFVVRYIAKLV